MSFRAFGYWFILILVPIPVMVFVPLFLLRLFQFLVICLFQLGVVFLLFLSCMPASYYNWRMYLFYPLTQWYLEKKKEIIIISFYTSLLFHNLESHYRFQFPSTTKCSPQVYDNGAILSLFFNLFLVNNNIIN